MDKDIFESIKNRTYSSARFEPHINLPNVGKRGQERISASKVLVVGAGGLGSPLLFYLTASGVGLIGVVDGDEVTHSNLQRQILYTNKDVGEYKVLCAEKQLCARADKQNFNIYKEYLSEENAEDIIREYDFVIDCTDNYKTRSIINSACKKYKKDWIYGSVYRYEAQLFTFNNHLADAPCFHCIFPQSTSDFNTRACEGEGVLSPIPGIIGCFQALELLKCVLKIGDYSKPQMKILNLLDLSVKSFIAEKRKDCEVCGNGKF